MDLNPAYRKASFFIFVGMVIAATLSLILAGIDARDDVTIAFNVPETWNAGQTLPTSALDRYEVWSISDQAFERALALPVEPKFITPTLDNGGCYVVFAVAKGNMYSSPSQVACDQSKLTSDERLHLWWLAYSRSRPMRHAKAFAECSDAGCLDSTIEH